VEVIFFVNLALNLTLNAQPNHVRITFANRRSWIRIDKGQSSLKSTNGFASVFLLLVDRVLKVTGQGSDLFDLEGQVVSQICQLDHNLIFNIPSFVCINDGLPVIITEYAIGVIEASFREKERRCAGVVDNIRYFGALLIRELNFPEIRDDILQKLAPSWTIRALAF
jgi:hypothetical protein